MATPEENKDDEVVTIELPAPAGWIKKFTPKKAGTPGKNVIFFISPTGEEIKHKKYLEQYLKLNPGGPTISEFDWGLGDSPRRSVRLSEKSKPMAPAESESPKKKQKRSNTKKGAKKMDDLHTDEVARANDKEAVAEVAKESGEVRAEDKGDTEAIPDEAIQQKPNVEAIQDEVEKAQTTPSAEAKIEGSTNTNTEVTSAKTQELNEYTAEIAGTNAGELKDEDHTEDEAEKSAINQDNNSDDQQAAESMDKN